MQMPSGGGAARVAAPKREVEENFTKGKWATPKSRSSISTGVVGERLVETNGPKRMTTQPPDEATGIVGAQKFGRTTVVPAAANPQIVNGRRTTVPKNYPLSFLVNRSCRRCQIGMVG